MRFSSNGLGGSHNTNPMNFSFQEKAMQVSTLKRNLNTCILLLTILDFWFPYFWYWLFPCKGHYIPQLAEAIFEGNEKTSKENYINLKGFIVSILLNFIWNVAHCYTSSFRSVWIFRLGWFGLGLSYHRSSWFGLRISALMSTWAWPIPQPDVKVKLYEFDSFGPDPSCS